MRQAILIIGIAVILGCLIRLSVTHKESPDSVYHLRRAKFATQHFPRTIIFDPTMNIPDGGLCIWPPLFDLALAIPSLKGNGDTLEQRAAYVPVIFAAFAIAAAGLVGAATRRKWGMIAAFFVAISPGHLQYSQLGHTDQHVAESFWGFLTLGCFLWSCRRRSRFWETAAGCALTFAVLTWQGAIFWAPIFGAGLIADALFSKHNLSSGRVLRVLGLPAILVTIATGYWLDGMVVPFTYVSFGWFQPVFLSATTATVFLFVLLRSPKRLLTSFVLMVFTAPVIFFGGQFLPVVQSGMLHLASSSEGSSVVHGGFLSYSKEWLDQIVEYRPLLADQWDWPVGYLSLSFFLSPLAMALWIGRLRKKFSPSFCIGLLAWGIFTFLFTLMQRRNVYYGSLLAAISAVELSAFLAFRISKRFLAQDQQRPFPVFITLFVVFCLPMLLYLPRELQNNYSAGKERIEALQELKRIMPSEFDMYDARFLTPRLNTDEFKNARSVFAFWSQGHLVTYFSERPVVANNFGYSFQDSLRFFLSENEQDALQIAKKHRSRFVLSLDIATVVNRYAGAIGKPPMIFWNGSQWQATPVYYRTLQARMHDFNAAGASLSDGLRVEPLQHFRLRYASKSGMERLGMFVPQFKIFEIVN